MKKSLLSFAMVSVLAITAIAQESVSSEDARKGARIVTEKLGEVSDAPFKFEGDLEKPTALRASEVRLLVIPDKKFSAESIEKAGKEIVPAGQLWMLRVSPAKDGKTTPNEKLRLVTIQADGEDHQVSVHYLGIEKTEKNGFQLVVFAKDKEPLLKLPLKKAENTQTSPIELSGRKEDDHGVLTLNFLGKYTAELTLARPE